MTVFQKPYGFIDTPQTGTFKGQSGKLKVLPLLVWTLKSCHSFLWLGTGELREQSERLSVVKILGKDPSHRIVKSCCKYSNVAD